MVQGGTFYNEAVLRAFEKEMGVNVIRPDIAGLMGAYGAALFGKAKAGAHARSTVLTQLELEHFSQKVNTVQCQGCGNHCQLTVNVFADGKRFISGNRCDKPVTGKANNEDLEPLRLQAQAAGRLPQGSSPREQPRQDRHPALPEYVRAFAVLAHACSASLGFEVVPSAPSPTAKLYQSGQAHDPQRHGLLPGQAEPRPHSLAV